MSYRGESPGKEAARGLGYAKVDRMWMYFGTHIVVAGDGGDIKYLLRQGVKKHNIVACDIDRSCVRKAETYGVRTYYADLASVVWKEIERERKVGMPYIASVNVDLCKSLIKGLPVLKEVLELLSHGRNYLSNVFFTFLCGRDLGLRKSIWEDNPGEGRKRYFQDQVGQELKDYYSYQSWTKTSTGSPMCMAFLQND